MKGKGILGCVLIGDRKRKTPDLGTMRWNVSR